MSTYIVFSSTIARIVSELRANPNPYNDLCLDYGYNIKREPEIQRLAADLHELNVTAFNYYYDKNEQPRPLRIGTEICDLVQTLKAAQCLRYQCTEGDIIERSLYIFLDRLCGVFAEEIVECSPEYEIAEWG